jgi:hypothetical protein
MNNLNENQYFVSKVLLKRFKIPGNSLQCYQVQTGEWIPKSPENACSSPGYNQLLRSGQFQPDNTLEADLSAVEFMHLALRLVRRGYGMTSPNLIVA